jgi:electron transport complex protein RnfA
MPASFAATSTPFIFPNPEHLAMREYLLLLVSAALVNNVILARFLGLCSFMGVTTRVDTAVGMGMATTFVITVSSMADWAVEAWLLQPFGLGYLRTVTFILVIAGAVQFTEMAVRKLSPTLFQMLGIYLPLITTNCAVLGVALLLVEGRMGFLTSTLFAFFSSLGYSLVMVMFAGLRERLAVSDAPRLFEGPPLGFITASLLALAFMGFSGISA